MARKIIKGQISEEKIDETTYLLSTKANQKRLEESIKQLKEEKKFH